MAVVSETPSSSERGMDGDDDDDASLTGSAGGVVVGGAYGFTVTGTWIPTCTAMACRAAAAWRPVTKGELATGRARDRDSWADVPM